jgi:hypothetical protein
MMVFQHAVAPFSLHSPRQLRDRLIVDPDPNKSIPVTNAMLKQPKTIVSDVQREYDS